MQRVGASVGERGDGERGDGIQARRGEVRPLESLNGDGPDGEAHNQSDAEFAHEQQQQVRGAVSGMDEQVDEADDEQHGDRIVEAGFTLERARQLAGQRRSPEQPEDRRAVGGGQDRAE